MSRTALAWNDNAGVAGVLSSPEGLTFDGGKTTNEGKASENDEDGSSQAAPAGSFSIHPGSRAAE